MTLVLILTCFFTPINIAFSFHESNDYGNYINWAIDLIYLIDIFVIFDTAIYDENDDLVEDRKRIAVNYLQGWFTVDLMSIIPFDLFFN